MVSWAHFEGATVVIKTWESEKAVEPSCVADAASVQAVLVLASSGSKRRVEESGC